MADAPAMTSGPNPEAVADAVGPAAEQRPAGIMIEQRVVAALGVHPTFAGTLITLAAVALYYLWKLLLGAYLLQAFAAAPAADAQRGDWTAVVWAALLGYVVAIMSILPQKGLADTRHLLSYVSDQDRADWVRYSSYRAASLQRSRRVGGLSALFGFCGLVYSAWSILAPASVLAFLPWFLLGFGWYIVVVPVVLFLLGRAAFAMLNGTRVSNAHLLPAIQFDILDLSPFAPLARVALRNASAWLVGAFIVSLFFLHLQLKHIGAIFILTLISVVLAVAALVIPLLAVHRRIRARKREELDVLHAAIDRDRAELLARAATATAAAQRLQGLLAYRAVVESAREWPLDISVLVRFALLLVLPALGWTAGALVDHYLNLYLGAG